MDAVVAALISGVTQLQRMVVGEGAGPLFRVRTMLLSASRRHIALPCYDCLRVNVTFTAMPALLKWLTSADLRESRRLFCPCMMQTPAQVGMPAVCCFTSLEPSSQTARPSAQLTAVLRAPEVLLQPSAGDARLMLGRLLRGVVESAKAFVRWMDGTCVCLRGPRHG